jgi:hypothetical protein
MNFSSGPDNKWWPLNAGRDEPEPNDSLPNWLRTRLHEQFRSCFSDNLNRAFNDDPSTNSDCRRTVQIRSAIQIPRKTLELQNPQVVAYHESSGISAYEDAIASTALDSWRGSVSEHHKAIQFVDSLRDSVDHVLKRVQHDTPNL